MNQPPKSVFSYNSFNLVVYDMIWIYECMCEHLFVVVEFNYYWLFLIKFQVNLFKGAN